jgi:hypothetical protein
VFTSNKQVVPLLFHVTTPYRMTIIGTNHTSLSKIIFSRDAIQQQTPRKQIGLIKYSRTHNAFFLFDIDKNWVQISVFRFSD